MIPGNGYRLANDVLLEISLHLVQPYVYTTLAGSVTAGSNTVTVGSLGVPTNACYLGAQLLVVDAVNGNEVITLTGFNTAGPTITATFALPHPSGTVVSGATWPLQQATDPIFTQAEMLMYLSRAQNEILSRLPVVYSRSSGSVAMNSLLQSSPSNMIEMERVSLSSISFTGATLVRDGNGTVMCAFGYQTTLVAGDMITVYQSSDSSFLGCFLILTSTGTGGGGFGTGGFGTGGFGGGGSGFTVTWSQDGAAASSNTASLAIFNRLYEQTQQEVVMQERTFRNDYFPAPTGWYEDRVGNYKWGVNVKPQGTFPINLIYSIRDNDVLTLADGFVAPDIIVPYIKYKAMEYIYSKDGLWASPSLASYCKMRVDRGILIVRRFFEGEQMGIGEPQQMATR